MIWVYQLINWVYQLINLVYRLKTNFDIWNWFKELKLVLRDKTSFKIDDWGLSGDDGMEYVQLLLKLILAVKIDFIFLKTSVNFSELV